MEEILASIRRIISDEPAPAGAAPALAPDPLPVAPLPTASSFAPPSAPVDDVMELTPDMRADAPPPPPPAPEPEPEPMPTPVSTYMPEPVRMPAADDSAIMSPQTEAVAAAALAGLSAQLGSGMKFEGGTVEGLVRDMLRPMLRDWMDRNLPTLVERLVEQEIERLARRRI
jgi:cell pole-organizing protein PopZ